MEKVERLLKAINDIVKEEDDDLREEISEFPAVDFTIKQVNKYEKKIAKLLKEQKKYFIKTIKSNVTKSEGTVLLSAVLNMILSDLFADDSFEGEMEEETKAFLVATISEITSVVMDIIDKDIAFDTLSPRTLTWIDSWSSDLASLMKLTTHEGIQNAIEEGLKNGEGIEKIIRRLEELPEFDRKRARMTATTEVLTANSRSQYEAYLQSPSVEGKTWKHSGARKIKPRPHHVTLSGTTVGLDEYFTVGSSQGLYPRDTNLPAKERIYCHCVLSPSVNEDILGLSKEEKEAIRLQKISELEAGN